MALSISSLYVSIRGKEILHGIDLTVHDGEFFSLLGSSGSGKSTLLKAVSGLMDIDSGEVSLNGVDLLPLPPQKRETTVMFQDQRLFTNMTVGENVTFALRNKGVSKAQCAKEAEHYLEMVQMSGFAGRRVHELSGGQAQRVALARALAASPKLLLLDEPFSALDENLRDDMRILVKSIQRKMKVMTVMVTHDQREALSMSDRVGIMEGGCLVQIDTPRNIYNHPLSEGVATFFSGADCLDGIVQGGMFRCGSLEIPVREQDGAYQAVVRQSGISLAQDGMACAVSDVQYKGDSVSVSLECKGAVLHCIADSHSELSEGDEVFVSIAPEAVLLFPKGQEA